MKFKLILFILGCLPASVFSQLNYGLSLSAGSSTMQTGNAHVPPGESFAAGMFCNYTDAAQFIYEVGLQYQFTNQKVDQLSKEFSSDVSWMRYHYIELKLPVTLGVKINSGIFKTCNLLLQGGLYGSYGINGNVSVWYMDQQGQTFMNEANNVYYQDIFHHNDQTYIYHPLKRTDIGSILRIGTRYKQLSVLLNAENGFINRNNEYDTFFKNQRLYLTVAYNFVR